jgi:hypothetical protein
LTSFYIYSTILYKGRKEWMKPVNPSAQEGKNTRGGYAGPLGEEQAAVTMFVRKNCRER